MIRWKYKHLLLYFKVPALGLILFLANVLPGWTQSLLLYDTGIGSGIEKEQFPDSLSREIFLQEILISLQLEGYPTAFVQSKTFSGDTLAVKFASGPPFEWIRLTKGNLEERFAVNAGFLEEDYRRRPLNFGKLKEFFDKVLTEAQNTGYPFASIRLDSLRQEGRGIIGSMDFQYGPLITFDSLEVTGDSRSKPSYLSRLLRIIPETAFSQAKVDRSMALLQKLPYVQLAGEPQLTFQNQAAKLHLPINDRPINTLDGIIGVFPNENKDNRLLVTGQFDLSLYNVSGRGRNYHLQWQRLSQYSQSLTVSAEEPMILGSLIDLKVSFNLLKEDTTFLNRDFRIDFGYRMSPQIYLGFFSRRRSGDLLSVSTGSDPQFLPDVADFRLNNYGLNLVWDGVDNRLLPREGWLSEFEVGVGNKKLLQNTGLPPSAYEGLDMNSIQYYLTYSLARYLIFSSGLGASLRVRAGEMANENLFLNDLFRLGGLRSVRGFNENFFFAKRYVYANFEPRFYFDNYSYFLLFFDVAGMQGNTTPEAVDYPISFGAGLSLETGEGAFNFIYALGKSSTQQLGLNFSKIHFGYTGRF